MSGGDIRTVRDARRLLQLAPTASLAEVRQAFRAAVRVAHPDLGGDADRLRQVIDANRILKEDHAAGLRLPPATVRAPTRRAPTPLPLEISAHQAQAGGEAAVVLPDGRQGFARIPPGLRAGDVVRLKSTAGPVLFRVKFSRGDMDVRGDNLWIKLRVAPSLLAEGGRLEVQTPAGPRSIAVSVEAGQRRLLRIPGAGLPARGPHEQGHLFVRLEADPDAAESPARSLLRRFTAAWAA